MCLTKHKKKCKNKCVHKYTCKKIKLLKGHRAQGLFKAHHNYRCHVLFDLTVLCTLLCWLKEAFCGVLKKATQQEAQYWEYIILYHIILLYYIVLSFRWNSYINFNCLQPLSCMLKGPEKCFGLILQCIIYYSRLSRIHSKGTSIILQLNYALGLYVLLFSIVYTMYTKNELLV